MLSLGEEAESEQAIEDLIIDVDCEVSLINVNIYLFLSANKHKNIKSLK